MFVFRRPISASLAALIISLLMVALDYLSNLAER